MKFGFDIDDTLIDLRKHAFDIYNQKLGKNVPLDQFTKLERVEIHELFDMTDEQGGEMWKSSLEDIYYTTCPVYPNALETLVELDQQGHEIYYITARPKEHGERTKEWMKAQGFPVQDERFFYGMKDDEKVQIIKRLDLDYYFDDKPDVVNTLVKEENLKVILKDQSYNRHLTFTRLVDWTEIQEILEAKQA
ncbi:putative HAD superfamily protein [Chryseomicrobium aureum]|uniref:5' nucleotidase, NT5C type n=1 Tax=Chryseomicrobium aureum TaxID=1441723 RepID=UPI0019573F19|nr:HAD family acid phosphatase [Chryseomicrobium aureum]MBM7706344.1 putative HAD superfamily protein [Chryseomicrobium aureum]